MAIADVNKSLPSNRMVYDVRRDMAQAARVQADLENLMTEYKLSDEEKAAWRAKDIGALNRLGVHPYFLPQISRLFFGSANNTNISAAAQLYKTMFVDTKSKP